MSCDRIPGESLCLKTLFPRKTLKIDWFVPVWFKVNHTQHHLTARLVRKQTKSPCLVRWDRGPPGRPISFIGVSRPTVHNDTAISPGSDSPADVKAEIHPHEAVTHIHTASPRRRARSHGVDGGDRGHTCFFLRKVQVHTVKYYTKRKNRPVFFEVNYRCLEAAWSDEFIIYGFLQ